MMTGDSHTIVEDLPSVILVLLVVEDLTVEVQVTILLLLGGTATTGMNQSFAYIFLYLETDWCKS